MLGSAWQAPGIKWASRRLPEGSKGLGELGTVSKSEPGKESGKGVPGRGNSMGKAQRHAAGQPKYVGICGSSGSQRGNGKVGMRQAGIGP